MSIVVAQTRGELEALREPRRITAVVMTMGALHAGHAELIREARLVVGPSGRVIVTDFVNPTQFGPTEDFARYPRTLDADVALSEAAGADIVFAPSVQEVHGDAERAAITVDPGPLGTILEGASRPGHFAGVLSVVAKLLHLTSPDIAFFGEKDYQQLVLISQMVDDLRFPVTVLPVATVREPDGLAMSSRNRYLTSEERALAPVLSQALMAAAIDAELQGAASAEAVGRALLDRPGVVVDYLVVTDVELGPARPGPGRVLGAIRIGGTRLIDNMPCQVVAP